MISNRFVDRLCLRSNGLARLAAYMFAVVTYALSLVRFRFSHGADFRGKLANQLFVDTLYDYVGLIRAGDLEVGRNFLMDFIGETHSKAQLITLNGRDIADADDFQFLFVSLANTFDHVLDQRPGQSMTGPRKPLVRTARDFDTLFLLVDDGGDFRSMGIIQLA